MAARTGGARTAGRRCKGRGAPRRRLLMGRVAGRRPAGATGGPRPRSRSCPLPPPLLPRPGPRGPGRRGAPPPTPWESSPECGTCGWWLRKEASEPPSPIPQPDRAPNFNSTGLVSRGHSFAPKRCVYSAQNSSSRGGGSTLV